MPRNSGGVYTPPIGTLGVSGTSISSTAYDGFIADLSTEITNSLNVNGTAPMLASLNMGSFSITNMATPVNSTDAATKAYVDAGIPTGAVFWFAANAPPAGFLECDGSSRSTTTFANLFAITGYTYGGSGANFNLPDLRGRFVRGWDHGAGNDVNTPSRAFASIEAAANASHTHTISQTPHVHGIIDPGHNHAQDLHVHGVTDPGHVHGGAIVPGGQFSLGTAGGLGIASGSTASSGTGISIQGAVASLHTAATGVSVNANNATVSNVASGSPEATPLNIALLPCIKT